jgi:hypothetical protein
MAGVTAISDDELLLVYDVRNYQSEVLPESGKHRVRVTGSGRGPLTPTAVASSVSAAAIFLALS